LGLLVAAVFSSEDLVPHWILVPYSLFSYVTLLSAPATLNVALRLSFSEFQFAPDDGFDLPRAESCGFLP
jgi:hypothetical protein